MDVANTISEFLNQQMTLCQGLDDRLRCATQSVDILVERDFVGYRREFGFDLLGDRWYGRDNGLDIDQFELQISHVTDDRVDSDVKLLVRECLCLYFLRYVQHQLIHTIQLLDDHTQPIKRCEKPTVPHMEHCSYALVGIGTTVVALRIISWRNFIP